MTQDYKTPLQELKRECSPHRTTSFEAFGIITAENMPAIIHALELAIALQPKPISEAVENEVVFVEGGYILQRPNGDWITLPTGCVLEWQPTHFYDISALPKPEEK